MTTSIFIKSCPSDFEFLSYCLRSIERFCTGFKECVVLIPEGSDLPLTKERIVKVKERGDPYVYQQILKLSADEYTDSDFCWNIDSDCVVTKPVTPYTFMADGKPIWLMTPIKNVLSNDPNTHAWNRAMKKFSGVDSEWEFMRRIGQTIPRWAYGCFRDFCQRKHGKTFEQWAQEQNREVSEYNLAGQFLYLNFPNFIHFHDTTYSLPEEVVRQYWSRGGLTDEIRAEMEEILK